MKAKWTCGECRESIEMESAVADVSVNRWAADHREKHRVEKLPPMEQADYYKRQIESHLASWRL